jgi:hypothetical protein
MFKKLLVLAVLALPILGAACSSDDGGDVTASASASGSSENLTNCEVADGTTNDRDSEVHVTLNEWAITLDEKTASAGNIEFHATNKGGETHELVLIKGAKPGALKVGDDGLDEGALPAGAAVVGEIEGVPSGKDCTGTFKLAAGDYTLVCNIVEDEAMSGMNGMKSHAQLGMISGFTVS